VAVVIKADCPDCGVVHLGVADETVRICTDDSSGAYSFRCAGCGAAVSHAARPDIVDLLVRAGCEQVCWRLPGELAERRSGPNLTIDDLLDFHLLLQGDTRQRELQELVGGAP